MKRIFTLLVLVSTVFTGFCQSLPSLPKGKQFTVITTLDQNIDMGMQMTAKSTSTNKVVVAESTAKNFTLVNTVDKFVFSGNMMGKDINYDSDKKEDAETEEGKQFGSMVGKKDTVVISASTGMPEAKQDKEMSSISESDNPMSGMMGGMQEGNAAIAGSILFKIPGVATAGNTWTDSTNVQGMKSNTVYTIENITDGTAKVTTRGTVKGSSTMEMQGNSLDMSIDTKTEGVILVDVKTSLVKKRNNVADISGTLDMMGQSMPFTSKTTTESVYQ